MRRIADCGLCMGVFAALEASLFQVDSMIRRHEKEGEPVAGSPSVIRYSNDFYFTVALTALSHFWPAVLVATTAKR
jgi:hypothetical protein